MRFTFPKKERLKRQKIIAQLFREGKTITVFPLRLYYTESPLPENVPVQAGFSVGRRHFKQAVQRNRIKRLMREAYRHNKAAIFNNSTTSYAFMFLYIGRDLPDFDTVNAAIKSILNVFEDKRIPEIDHN